MDESALRRELESAGQAVRNAEEIHAAALTRLESLQIEATGLQVRREELGPAPVPAGVADADQAVVDDVTRIRNHPLVPASIPVYGYVYDVKSGRLIEVEAATAAGAAS